MNKMKQIVVAAVILFGAVQISQAAFMDNVWDLGSQGTVGLDTVIGQDLTLQYGDKLFYHDEWFSSPQGLGGVILPSPAAINISPSVSIEGYYGLQFSIVGFQVNSNQAANFHLEFDVYVHPDFPENWISDVHMDLIGGGAAGFGNASITESVSTPSGDNVLVDDLLNEKTALYVVDGPAGSFDQRQDWGYVLPYQKQISIFKDIGITGGTEGSAHISAFTQHFSQIPEPATMALFALGGVTMLAGRRRKA